MADRVKMTNADGAIAQPLAEDVPTWQAEGWRVADDKPATAKSKEADK